MAQVFAALCNFHRIGSGAVIKVCKGILLSRSRGRGVRLFGNRASLPAGRITQVSSTKNSILNFIKPSENCSVNQLIGETAINLKQTTEHFHLYWYKEGKE